MDELREHNLYITDFRSLITASKIAHELHSYSIVAPKALFSNFVGVKL